jgi:hypothetical protein
MQILRNISAVMLLFLCASVLAKQPELQGHTGTWCLVLERSQACLPANLSVKKVGPLYVYFGSPEPTDIARKLYFNIYFLGDSENGDSRKLDELNEVFLLVDSEDIGPVNVRRYEIDPSVKGVPRLTTYVVEVAASFALEIASMSGDLAQQNARDFAEQWASESRVPPFSDK